MTPKQYVEIYDTIDQIVHNICSVELNSIYKTSKSNFFDLKNGKIRHLCSRACLFSKKDIYVKTVVSLKTKKEYECVCPQTLFLHLGIESSKKEKNAVALMMRGGIITTSLKDDVFCLKENVEKVNITHVKTLTNYHLFADLKKERDIQRALADTFRKRLTSAIKQQTAKKLKKSEELLGCSFEFFVGYMQGKFLPGMTWENRGTWHIDHIIPCNTFDLHKEEEQRKCFHYSNLRPLWAEDNLKRPNNGKDLDDDILRTIVWNN